MKKIKHLTPSQEARFPEFVDKWTKIGLSTLPADRKRAEASIRAAYLQANLDTPKIVWCSSPVAMAFTRAILEMNITDAHKSLGDSVGDSVRASVRASVWASVWDRVGASVWDSVGASVGANLRSVSFECGYGQHDASWLGFYDFFKAVCGLDKEVATIQFLSEIAQSAGWFLPHAHICWVSERHSIVCQDEQRRIHCENGPAISYPDGWSIFAWHGIRVPREWIEDKKSLTPAQAITWKNIEHRRAACEIIGWEAILKELNAVTIDKDADPEIGELVEVDIPDIGRERFLRVLCGTGRTFALPVPPDMPTALAANAWGFDIPADLLTTKEFRT